MGAYHHGERIAQERAGLLDNADFSSAAIGSAIPDIARDFLAEQPVLIIGGTDANGDVWASQLTGEPGFISAPGPTSLDIAAVPPPGDPLHEPLTHPTRLGMLAMEPATRRRMRMNGTARPTPGGLHVTLDQVYANCPKYIQKREPTKRPTVPAAPRHSRELSTEQVAFLATADTFFIATADLDGNADTSHRGGNPGFLQTLGPTRLRWPDYVGNAMFNTLGNLQVNPRAGLLVPDWATGTLLQLTGTATVDWNPDHADAVPGARRIVEFTVHRIVQTDHASPLSWSAPQYSRFNPPAPQPSEGATA
ncbi:pyridoxamine 5'-phosphate oxidase family protein [Streptomyces shenzhenensis]|uniref:pyridoxamine 5'-phosphate oxidase family protein n=1 Tax=Streptomyces shenzhenensis TaxID=943815 RepID=UPI0015F10F9E|nr:pyridoxamine 5'-phosphate oxidase family protein [Streptomyces shenzhenensis]